MASKHSIKDIKIEEAVKTLKDHPTMTLYEDRKGQEKEKMKMMIMMYSIARD